LLEHIRAQILGSRLHGEGYRKIWARLRHAGIRSSARRVRRLMGQHGLLAPHRVGRPEQRAHDGTITTVAVDMMWGTDMTETVTLKEGRARVFVAIDHCSGECVGNHAARSGNRFEALEPVHQGVLRHFGRVEKDTAKGLALRRMLARGRGSVLLVGSVAGFIGLPDGPAYSASKAGLWAYGEALRAAHGPAGLRVTLVAPGLFESAMSARFLGGHPFEMPVEEVAVRVERALLGAQGRVVMPWFFGAALRGLALLPAPVADRLVRRFRFRIAPEG
jgi:hypothetical protein